MSIAGTPIFVIENDGMIDGQCSMNGFIDALVGDIIFNVFHDGTKLKLVEIIY